MGPTSDAQPTQDLLRLIMEYQLAVLGFVQAFRRRFKVDEGAHILSLVMSGKLPDVGSLDDRYETRYQFHGVGCSFTSDRGELDFDFGPGGRHDGFNGWKLWMFAQSLPEDYPMFQRLKVVESVLGELVTDGLVERPRWAPSPHLCYLKKT